MTINYQLIFSMNILMKLYLTQLEDECIDVQDDISTIYINDSEFTIADFGCDNGISTCSLALLFQQQVIGIDSNANAVAEAMAFIQCFLDTQNFQENFSYAENVFIERVNKIRNLKYIPMFTCGNVVSGENLPQNIKLAYCKRILNPIHEGDDNNSISGMEGVYFALKNITKCVFDDGWIVIIEKKAFDYQIGRAHV
jgi:hypothetical protein